MAGYTRQSTYTDGDIIQAADSNDEFDPNYMTDIECLDFIIDVLKLRLTK